MRRLLLSVVVAGLVALPSRAQSTFDFLLPTEGDVIHAQRIKVMMRVTGGVPSGLLAVHNGVWLETPVQVEKDILTVELSGLHEGVQAIRLMYLDSADRIRSTKTTRFFVRLPEPPPPPPSPPEPPKPPKLRHFGRVAVRVEGRNEEAATRVHSQAPLRGLGTVPETDSTYAYDTLVMGAAERPFSRHVNATLEGSYGVRSERWEADVKATASTQENRFRQPVNRISAHASYGPWARVTVGDVYPEYNPLIFSGTRVRGAEVGAAIVQGEERTHWAYTRVVSGETQRSVPAYIIRSRFGGVYDTTYVPGTRAQRLTAFRLGTGGGDAFDAGVTLMKAASAGLDSVAEDVNEYLYGPAPSENLVSGLDVRTGFWDGKLEVYGRGAFSLYTRDRSLGAFTPDTSGTSFDAARYRRVFVLNPTTKGWEHLASDGEGGGPDYSGFMNATSAYAIGVSTSFPWKAVVLETDLGYSHLGKAYHSEGNLFLGADPGKGWTLQQRVGFWENRIHTGVEFHDFRRDYGDHLQSDRTVRGEVRFAPADAQSSVWLNAGVTRQKPLGYAEYRSEQDFDEFNVGGTRKLVGGHGAWTVFGQYGFTRAHYRIVDPLPEDPSYPVSRTHAVTTSVLYKFRARDFTPKFTHAYADNGVQKPAHTFGCGAQTLLLDRKVRLDGNIQVNEYARSLTRNGIGWGQNAMMTLRFRERESWKLTERASWQGARVSVIAGGHYERSF